MMIEIGSTIAVTEELIDRLALTIALESCTEKGRLDPDWPNSWPPENVAAYRHRASAALAGYIYVGSADID